MRRQENIQIMVKAVDVFGNDINKVMKVRIWKKKAFGFCIQR